MKRISLVLSVLVLPVMGCQNLPPMVTDIPLSVRSTEPVVLALEQRGQVVVVKALAGMSVAVGLTVEIEYAGMVLEGIEAVDLFQRVLVLPEVELGVRAMGFLTAKREQAGQGAGDIGKLAFSLFKDGTGAAYMRIRSAWVQEYRPTIERTAREVRLDPDKCEIRLGSEE